MGLIEEVRDATWQATHDMSVLKTVADGEIANYEKNTEDPGESFLIVKHGFGQAMTDAWKTMEDMHELIVVHPGSTESVTWYNPWSWLSYALENGKFNRVVSSIDTARLRNAVDLINAAREGIEDSINYFADLAASPEVRDARKVLEKHRGGVIHGAANPEIALSALPNDTRLYTVQMAYMAAKLIHEVAEPIMKDNSALRRARGD